MVGIVFYLICDISIIQLNKGIKMEFERENVDYTPLALTYRNRGLVGVKGWRYIPYVVEILACRELKIKNRAIADWLNTIVHHDILLTNNTLISYISEWKIKGFLNEIDRRDIDNAKKKIQKMARKNGEGMHWNEQNVSENQIEIAEKIAEANEKLTFSVIDLLKEISKTIPNLNDSDRTFCKNFYDEHKNKLSLEGMRNEIIGEFVKKM